MQQAVDQHVGFTGLYCFDAPEGCNSGLAGNSGGIPRGPDKLYVLMRTGRGDLDEHVAARATRADECNGFAKISRHYGDNQPKQLTCCCYAVPGKDVSEILEKLSNYGASFPHLTA